MTSLVGGGVPRLLIGTSLKNDDIFWASGLTTCDPSILLEINSRKIMVVRPTDYGPAKQKATVHEVIVNSDLKMRDGSVPLKIRHQALALLEKFGVFTVAVGPDFPIEVYKFLEGCGVQFRFPNRLFPERRVKTAEEIAKITVVQRATEEVFARLVRIVADAEIRDGKLWNNGEYITSEMLRATFEDEMYKKGCIVPETSIIVSGDQAVDAHCSGFGPILANTPIIFDLYPRSRTTRYWADMTRTIVKGKLNSEARKMYDTVLEAQLRAVEMVRSGVMFDAIHDQAARFFEDRGFKTGRDEDGGSYGFYHGIGHGVGIELHEYPIRHEELRLLLGDVITIEPGLYYRGRGGVRIEDMVVVTENGCDNLTLPTKELLELP